MKLLRLVHARAAITVQWMRKQQIGEPAMKTLLSSIALLGLSMSVSFAGEASGSITNVNTNAHTMTLDNGQTYILPAEFDISLIGQGMRVSLAFDETSDGNLVTDMEQVD